ncbi:Gfo/Idh/MocA family protein [Candidatus Halobonum tyrrellensis]|uniref:Glucose-fructose oxidoreductase n=1 Tax=Candidatus Halobonum tyrrellensis G22 TaxID=1324957 RepID=V4HDG0_9EURY|nr:Gfo/Idh/MocA family oxidoreductase [Candidatus Halobonum tyrrellensis]ESP88108.1 glucose-fructose oxidoreductase [Candidatus Halobonum tyrrellensis G22]
MRFGILGTADIARESVIPGIRKSDHEAAAVASRDHERAERFAEECDITEAYGSYEALFDADIDAVYNPLPNALHAEWSERAADAGLHVLCEKPLTTTADRTVDLFDHCADAGVTLMEAFMYQFHPRTERTREVAVEELGDVRSVDATFTFRLPGPPDIRLDADLGGGALFDVGSYAVSAARGFLGEPDRAYAHFADTRDSGVDTDVAGLLEYDDGRTARVAAGFDTAHVERYRVEAVDGFLEARDCFAPGEREVAMRYEVDGRRVEETFDAVDQYEREVEGFAAAAESGSPPRVDRAETLGNVRTLDALRESAAEGVPVDVA